MQNTHAKFTPNARKSPTSVFSVFSMLFASLTPPFYNLHSQDPESLQQLLIDSIDSDTDDTIVAQDLFEVNNVPTIPLQNNGATDPRIASLTSLVELFEDENNRTSSSSSFNTEVYYSPLSRPPSNASLSSNTESTSSHVARSSRTSSSGSV